MSSAKSWWDLAHEWRDNSRELPHGLVQARLTEFSHAAVPRVVELTVRRADAALRFAERLVQQKRIERSEALRDVAITYMEAMQRIDRFDPTVVDGLLRRLSKDAAAPREESDSEPPITGSELRGILEHLSRVGRDVGATKTAPCSAWALETRAAARLSCSSHRFLPCKVAWSLSATPLRSSRYPWTRYW